jgi:hypothetical protein
MHDVGLHMGVLNGPKQSLKLLASSTLNSFEESPTTFKRREDGLTC